MLFYSSKQKKKKLLLHRKCQISKVLATCYSKVLQLTPYCSRLLYFFTIIFSFLHSHSPGLFVFFSLCLSDHFSLLLFFALLYSSSSSHFSFLPLNSGDPLRWNCGSWGFTELWCVIFGFFSFFNLRLWSKYFLLGHMWVDVRNICQYFYVIG